MAQQIYGKYIRKKKNNGLFTLFFFIAGSFCLMPLAAQTATALTIDNNYDDWQKVQPIATFSINYSPVYFQQEKTGRTTTHDIEVAQYWKRAGTLLKAIKAQKDTDTLYLYIESHSNFAENLSVYLYLFKARNKKEENTCTLEVVPVTAKKGEGLILLWKKGEQKPRKCGHLVASDFQMELSLPFKDLPSEFQTDFAKISFDVSTSYQQKTGAYEDYFFTTIYGRDIH